MREIKLKPYYDLIVVGGGIQGCAMLWEAQSRGLNTLLVEAEDYCSQTSANSLKTIHGGVRYLQTLNVSRTCRSAKEQEILLKIAPHLVHPLPCLLPTERKLKRSRQAVSVGFALYNALKKLSSPGQGLPAAKCLSKSQLEQQTRLLDSENVTGAGLWYDAQVQHAEQLGLAFVKTALSSGATAYNYLQAKALSNTNDQAFQLLLECQLSSQNYEVSADSLVFCTAAKTEQSLSGLQLSTDKLPEFCLAMNLVIKNRYAPMAIGLQSGFSQNDAQTAKRLLFAAPWRNSTLFGTWYFDAESKVTVSREQMEYCLADINRTYPGAKFTKADIAAVHSGHLPVNIGDKRPEDRLVDVDVIDQPIENRNLLVVIPAKYTTCRSVAEQTVDLLAKQSNLSIHDSVSSQQPLLGADCGDEDDFEAPDLSTEVMDQLSIIYGNQVAQILKLCKQNSELAELIPGSDNHIKAQLEFELEHGQVQKLDDFVLRRSFLASDGEVNKASLDYCLNRINQFHSREPESRASVEKLLNNTLY